MIGDRRAPEAPPVDGLAECVVLTRLLQHPDWIDRYDVGPLLTFPEHRWIWAALLRVRQTHPALADHREFVRCWLADIQQHHPDRWLDLVDLVWPSKELDRGWQEYELVREADPEATLLRADFDHSFEWWLSRLQAIAEARRGIQAAQELAERCWRVPEHPFGASDAHSVLRKQWDVREEQIGMEVPD